MLRSESHPIQLCAVNFIVTMGPTKDYQKGVTK